MKIFKIKFLMPLCLWAFASTLFATNTEARIIEKNHAFADSHLLIMEDNSMWMAYPVSKRKRSLKEWWKKVTIEQPEENFLFSLNDWKIGTAVYVREHLWTDENADEMKKYNQSKIADCTHILENPFNQQLAFVRPLRMTEAIELFMELAKVKYKEGKEKGEKKGYKIGYDAGRVLGRNEGQDSGYQEGLQVGIDRGNTQGLQDGREQGYREGYQAGYEEGYEIAQKAKPSNQ